MVNGKKLLASILVGAMVITPVASPIPGITATVYADTVEATAKAVITSSKGYTYEYDLSKKTLREIIESVAQDDDTIVVTGSYTVPAEIEIDKDITIDISNAEITDASKIKAAGTYCAKEISTGKTQYAKKDYKNSTLTITFPEKYNDTTGNGVSVDYVMKNGWTEHVNPYKDPDESNTSQNVTIDIVANRTVTCTKEGTATVTVTVTDNRHNVTKTVKQEYENQAPFGHNYGTPDKDGIITISRNASGNITPNNAPIQVKWALRGDVASKDENGYTKIESVKTKCTNTVHVNDLENAKSAVIKKAEVTKAATSSTAGETTYTIEVVTADNVTILVKDTIKDIPALDATTVGDVVGVEFLATEYTVSGDTYTKKDTTKWLDRIYLNAEPNAVEGKYYKTAIADNGDISYRIKYSDAFAAGKTGYVEGTLSVVANDNQHVSKINACGANELYYPAFSVIITNVTGDEGNKVVSGTSKKYMKLDIVNNTDANNDGVPDNLVYTTTIARPAVGDTPAVIVNANDTSRVLTEGTHTFDMNNGVYNINRHSTTTVPGLATITCKYCSRLVKNIELPMLDKGVQYEDKTSNAITGVDATADAKVFTKKATCDASGYDYYWAIDPNDLGEESQQGTFYDGNVYHKFKGAIHKIAGTETKATGHDWRLLNAHGSNVVWRTNVADGKETCEITYICHNNENDRKTITYHVKKGTDTENNKYSAITSEVVKGADCSETNMKVYTVTDVKDVLGKAVDTQKVMTGTVGAHNFTDTLAWADNCKTATVTRKCANTNCLKDYDTTPLRTDAKVTGVDNTDGTTTYTASVDDKVIGTKTVYNLSKAEVIVNDGKAIDKGAYTTLKALKEAVEKAVVVKINGVVIDSKLYKAEVAFVDDNGTALTYAQVTKGNYTVTVSAAADAKGVIETKTGNAAIVKLDPFGDVTTKFDEEAISNKTVTIDYDGKAHTVVASVTEKDATVKYMVSDKLVTDASKRVYDADKAELTDAGTYYVYYQISKEGFTTKSATDPIVVTISKVTIKEIISVDKATILYGESFTATTGDKDLDAKIGIKTVDTSKKSVGEYSIESLVEYDKNYNVDFDIDWITIKPRNATIVLKDFTKKYDGKVLKPVYTVDGVLPGDDLNVQVSAVGGKEIKNVGTYKVIATANNANYTVEKTTATVVITKLANSISVKKASATVKVAKVKKAAQYFTMGATAKNKSTVVAKKVKGSAKLSVSSAGKVKVAKGTKKGTYTMYVKLAAKGSTNYESATKTVKVTVKVK